MFSPLVRFQFSNFPKRQPDSNLESVFSNAGVSRSAAICIAYIMKKFKIDVKDATETVSDVRPQICPNPGFVRQLEQYYINLHPELKKKASETVVCSPPAISSSSASETPNSNETTPSTAPSEVTAAATPEEAQTSSQEKMVEVTVEKAVYICRSCRRPLFTVTDLMPHQVSQHSIAYHKRDKNNATSAPVCSSYFLQEPLQWMGNVDENEGKIGCVKCHSKIGFWKWDGQQCSCGTWVTPAIQIAKNRVDERIMPITSLVPASEAS